MKILYFDASMGASGDMIISSLFGHLSESRKKEFISKMNSLLPGKIVFETREDIKEGVSGFSTRVILSSGEEESVDYRIDGKKEDKSKLKLKLVSKISKEEHDHKHPGHGEHHHGMGMREIEEILRNLNVEKRIKEDSLEIFKIIGEAESKVHGVKMDKIHFHEIGQLDALADIVGCAMLFHYLAADRIVVSPVNVGRGFVKCAHGILPVPAPATALIIEGMRIYSGNIEGELLTPTGAAVLSFYAEEFSYMPQMGLTSVSSGFGKKKFPVLNALRSFLGEVEEETQNENVYEIQCNIDDGTPEELSFAMERVMEKGALDAFITPVIMKKGRPGFLLTVLSKMDSIESIRDIIFKYTDTIGLRYSLKERYVLKRVEHFIELGDSKLRLKESSGFGVNKIKAEFDDLREYSVKHGISIREARNMVFDKIKQKK